MMADTASMQDTSFYRSDHQEMKKKAFTIVEVILVVTILGILAAIAFPGLQDHVAKAKESAVRNNLTTIRSQIEIYKLQHEGVPPGYKDGAEASIQTLILQLTATSTVTGAVSEFKVPVDPYVFGPYLKKILENTFNGLSTIAYLNVGTEFSAAADGTSSGWLYKRETSEFRLNWTGKDTNGSPFYDL